MTENYRAKKFADVLCTEDKATRLVMLPINQAQLWAKTEKTPTCPLRQILAFS